MRPKNPVNWTNPSDDEGFVQHFPDTKEFYMSLTKKQREDMRNLDRYQIRVSSVPSAPRANEKEIKKLQRVMDTKESLRNANAAR